MSTVLFFKFSEALFFIAASFKRYLIDGGRGQKEANTLNTGETSVTKVTPFNNLITALDENNCISVIRRELYRQIRLEAIVNTHPDADHYGGINALLGTGSKKIRSGEKFTVYCPIITTPAASLFVTEEVERDNYRWIENAEWYCPHFWFQTEAPGLVYTGLEDDSQPSHVEIGKEIEDCNETSILTTVRLSRSTYKYDVVLTGDSNDRIILDTLELRGCMTVGVFQVPHHGSRENSCYDFYMQFHAKIYFISHGANKLYKHPHSEVITGILSAAVDKKRDCIIVVTATWFEESKINYFMRKSTSNWRKFVKIYYFDESSSYITLDCSELDCRPKGLRKYTVCREKV